MARKPRCVVPACATAPFGAGRLYCLRHWNALPEDIRERILWAKSEADIGELRAAINAANVALVQVA